MTTSRLNTPWGGHSDWPRQPLVTALSGEVDAGTRFFRHLEDLVAHPTRDPDLLELAYICLGLGFRGQYRLQAAAGEASITAMRGQIARLLRNVETLAAPLSPHADGVKVPDAPRRFAVPIWTVWLVAVALAAGIYTLLSCNWATRPNSFSSRLQHCLRLNGQASFVRSATLRC